MSIYSIKVATGKTSDRARFLRYAMGVLGAKASTVAKTSNVARVFRAVVRASDSPALRSRLAVVLADTVGESRRDAHRMVLACVRGAR